MSYALTQGYELKNYSQSAGTKRVLIAQFEHVSISATAGAVTGITVDTGKQFWAYDQEAEVANFKSSYATDAKTGNGGYTETSYIEVQQLSSAQIQEIHNLNIGRTVHIHHMTNGKYFLLGAYQGLKATSELEGGVAMGDFAGNKLTFTGKNTDPILEVPANLISALLSPA